VEVVVIVEAVILAQQCVVMQAILVLLGIVLVTTLKIQSLAVVFGSINVSAATAEIKTATELFNGVNVLP